MKIVRINQDETTNIEGERIADLANNASNYWVLCNSVITESAGGGDVLIR